MAKSRDDYIREHDEDGTDIVSFHLVDKKTVERRIKEGDVITPFMRTKKYLNIPKDKRWNTKQINSKMLAGILNGDSIPNIANSLMDVIGNNKTAATRNARTIVTGAENAGRKDSYKALEEQGVIQKKVWIATADDRTRESHLLMDGEEVDVDEPFSNGLMYPGDPSGDASEVYNCRCTMRTHIVGIVRQDTGEYIDINTPHENAAHKQQIEAEEQRREDAKPAKEEKEKAKESEELHTNDQDAYDRLKRTLALNGVSENKVEMMETQLTSDEIIDKLAGGDMTDGSCATLSLAYAGNTAGVDVTDFRGGMSCKTFQRESNIENALKSANADIQIHEVKNESKDTAKILKDLPQDGTEYILSAGKHAAIVRNTEDGLQYLEMQSSRSNGWKAFESVYKSAISGTEYKNTVADTLNSRFGCKKTANRPINLGRGQKLDVMSKVMLAKVDSIQATEEFKDVLGYINTDTDKQKKGASGSVK